MSNLFYQFHIFKSQLSEAFSHEKHLHTARFAYPHELSHLSFSTPYATSLLLGTDQFNRILRLHEAPSHPELGNLGIFAPPRSGKSVHLTCQLLAWNESAIVNDPKGEFFRNTAGYKVAQGHQVLVFNPTGQGSRFDPLHKLMTEDEFNDAATQLLYTPHEGEGQRFTQRAISMLAPLFLASREERQAPFPYTRHMLRLGLRGAASRLDTVSPALCHQFLDDDLAAANFDDRFLTSAWATLCAGMRPLLTDAVTRSLAASDFTAEEVICGDRPSTLYCRWPERYLLTLRPLMKLLLGTLLEDLKKAYDDRSGQGCRKVLCLIDEAGVTPIHELEKHVATANARGISFILAYQAISQIAENHGKYNAETILNSLDSKLFFRQASLETAEYVSRLLGYQSGFAHSENEHGESKSTGTSEREIPLLTPQQIMQLKDGALIGFHRDLPPFKATSLKWWQFPEMRRRQQRSPPSVAALPGLEDIPQRGGETHEAAMPKGKAEQEEWIAGILFSRAKEHEPN